MNLYFSFPNLILYLFSYLLPDEKNIKSCKTKRAQKSSSPIWDEYFVIDGVAQSQLRKKQLGIRVVNWHFGINKKNSLLGELRIGCKNVFDFHSLASPIIASPSERLLNERVVYSPLVRGDKTQGRNRRPVSDIGTETRGLAHSCNQNSQSVASTTRSDQDLDDEAWSDLGDTVNPLVQNLKRLNTTSDEEHEDSNNISIHVSKFDPDADVIVNETNNSSGENNNNDENSLKEVKVKPPRPPPPTRLSLADGEQSPNGNLSPRDYRNPQTPDSVHKSITPTFSRLMSNLPMSPKRGRRLSWGGESELSLESPRSIKSPANHQGMQSGQWDLMISKPKQWIYCWQTLVVSVSE